MKVPNKVLDAVIDICAGLDPVAPGSQEKIEMVLEWAKAGKAKRAEMKAQPAKEE